MAVTIIRPDGGNEQVELNGMALYREALASGLSLRQLVNRKFPTVPGHPCGDAFQQMCISAGLRFAADQHTGIPAANLLDVLDPSKDAAGSYTNAPAVPDSRILFPAALMELVEDKLQSKENEATAAFESLVGYRKTVASARVEQPVISYTGAEGPEEAQFQYIAQNARPPIMLSIKASDVSRKIPTTSIAMEISHEALQSNSLDFVAMTLTRFTKISNYNEWIAQLALILAGDPDSTNTTMATGKSALTSFKASTLDSAIVANGVLSHKAWLAYLHKNHMSMTKTHIVCDFNAAMAIENRTDRPTNVQNNSSDRLDVPYQLIYPAFQPNIKVLALDVGKFTANTLMGLDHEAALAKVTSSVAEYQAVEDIVMKRSMELRFDRGFILFRLFDQAFNTMTLIA